MNILKIAFTIALAQFMFFGFYILFVMGTAYVEALTVGM